MKKQLIPAPGLLRFIFCLGLILNGALCYGQESGYTVKQYTTENGLPQNSVKDIKFDEAGYCWLSTEMGLVRFDGKTFKTYGTSEIKGLYSDRIHQMNIEIDSKVPLKPIGDLYAYTMEGQILSVNSSDNVSSSPKIENARGLRVASHGRIIKNNEVIAKIDSLDGTRDPNNAWICGMGNDKAYYYNNQYDNPKIYYLEGKNVTLISRELVKTYAGYYTMALLLNKFLIQILPGNKVLTWQNGLLQNQFNKIEGELAKKKDYLACNFKIWYCTHGTFIYCGNDLYEVEISDGKLVGKMVLKDIRIPSLISVYYSSEQKRYYLGSGTGGLYVVQLNSFQYPKGPPAHLEFNPDFQSFYAQAKLNDSLLFAKNILFSLNNKPSVLNLQRKISGAIYADRYHSIYFNEVDQRKREVDQLKRYDWKSGRIIDMYKLDSDLRSIFKDSVTNMLVFSTISSFGKVDSNFVVTTQPYPGKIQVISMSPFRESEFLLATQSGLKWYNSKSNKILQSVLDSVVIRAVLVDSSQRLWISTYGKGFYLKEKGKLYPMPYGPRQALKTVHSFIEDKKGNFWLPTNNGLYLTKKADLIAYANGEIQDVYFYTFDVASGLRSNEFNGACSPSYLWMKDSLLSLPSINGLVWFYPNKLKPLYPDNRIFIDRIVINKKDTLISNNQLTLPPDFGVVSVTISSPYFGIRENMELEYTLKGTSTNWVPLAENGEIVLRDISPGTYEIIVRKRGLHVRQNGQELKLSLVILPWFYNTWWFYLILLLSIILASFLITRQRIKNLEEKSRMLQKQVEIRTQKLSETVLDLETSEMALLKSNQVKDKMITMVLHDLRSPLRFISVLSSHLLSNFSSLDHEKMADNLLDLNNGTQALMEFTERFFRWAILQQEDFTIQEIEFPLRETFTEIEQLYVDIVKINGNKLFISHTSASCYTDPQILAFIIRNLIDNANKNTRNGEIHLSAGTEQTPLTICVSDNGNGMTEEQIESFYARNRKVTTDSFGSVLITQMLDKIRGKLDISSTQGEGSRFCITLPNHRQYETASQAAATPSDS